MLRIASFCGGQGCRKREQAFTLVELLTAMAVLSLLLVLVIAIFDSISNIYSKSNSSMSALSEARFALDRIGSDLALRPNREDLPITLVSQVGNDAMYFYSAVPSPTPGTQTSNDSATSSNSRGLALTAYRITASGANTDYELERAVNGISWDTTTPLEFVSTANSAPETLSPPPDADFDVAADAVFRIELCIIDQTGSIKAVAPQNPYDFVQNVAAIVVTVAALDSKSRKMLSNPSKQLASLVAQFSDSEDGVLPAVSWGSTLSNINALAAATGIPVQVLSSIRISTRTYRVK